MSIGNIHEFQPLDKHPTCIPVIKDDSLMHEAVIEGESCQTVHYSEAEKKAHIPFIHHHLMECDYDGLHHKVKDHDITLRIPEGAVTKGETVHFEIGVAMYGPFNFPENTAPVSPIIWLCVQEKSTVLKKPFQLILPHFLTNQTRDRLSYHQVGFAKANHNSYSIAEDEQMIYNFNLCDGKSLFASSGYKCYGVLKTTHCCFYCLVANQTLALASDTEYCLVRVERPLSSGRNEVYFAAVYFLDTCIRALREQFPKEDKYEICRCGVFKFEAEEDTELCIRVIPPHEHDQCLIALEPNPAEIRESNINFWKKDFNNMKLQHEMKMYPPRVKMTVTLRNPNNIIKLPVKFEGCSSDSQLNIDITFPLGNELSSPSTLPVGSHPEYCSNMIVASDEKPKPRDVFRKLLPLANNWKTIGGLLGVERHVLDCIKRDEEGVRDCLQAMLSEWLKQVDPPPTWTDVVEAVEEVDSSKAEEIRQYVARH